MSRATVRRCRNKLWQRYGSSYGWWVDRRTVKRRQQRTAQQDATRDIADTHDMDHDDMGGDDAC